MTWFKMKRFNKDELLEAVVTNYYLVGKLSTSLNLSSYQVSIWSKSLSISGGDSNGSSV